MALSAWAAFALVRIVFSIITRSFALHALADLATEVRVACVGLQRTESHQHLRDRERERAREGEVVFTNLKMNVYVYSSSSFLYIYMHTHAQPKRFESRDHATFLRITRFPGDPLPNK